MIGNTSFGFSGSGGSTPPPSSNNWLLDGNTNGAEKYFGTNDNFSIPLYTNGIARGIILNTGDFGFGTTTPTSRVHITGLDSTSLNYALKVDNSASSPLLYVRNDGYTGVNLSTFSYRFQVGNDIDGNGLVLSTVANQPLVLLGKNTVSVPTGYLGIYDTNGNTKVALSANQYCVSDYINTGLNFGIGAIFNPSSGASAKLHVQGVDATFSYYALKVDNSASSPLLYVRNDGNVGIGIVPSIADTKLEIKVATDQRFLFRNFTHPVIGAALTLQAINDIANNVVNVVTLGLDWYHASRSNLFSNYSNIIVPTAKVHIIGENSASDLFALKIENLALSPLFFVRNDGAVGINVSTPLARFHNFGLNNSINQRLEPVANVTEDTTGNTVNTTDATVNVTAQTIAVPTDKVVSIESTIVYRKTAGAGVGTVGDGTTIKLNSSVKNVSGTLTLDTVQNTYTGTTNAIVGVSATYTISGTNVLVSVTGVVNDSITWNVITKINTVS